MARGVALVILGGLAAGCSSDASRFDNSIFTGSVRQQAPVNQAYPGNLDHSSTGSVQGQRSGGLLNRAGLMPKPSADVGNGGQMQVASVQQPAPIYAAPSGAVSTGPALAPVARSALDPSVTGTTQVQHAQPLPQAQQFPQAQQMPQAPAATQQASLPQPVQTPRPAGQGGWSPEGGTQVQVRPGDTISALSRRYNVPEDQIRRANGITGDALVAGRTITIPSFGQPGGPRTAAAPTQQPQAPQEEPNQVAVLPQQPRPSESTGQAAPAPNATASPAPATGSNYTVVAGDTLSAISRRTGVGIDAIRRANGLSDGVIRIGQQLVIPGGSTPQAQPSTQVAAAPRSVDPVVTGGPSSPPAAAQQPVSSYTPPTSTPRQIDVASLDNGAQAPDATGVGKMRWPARGRVVAGFGASVAGKANDGIDISMPEGTSVRAAENGVVIYAGDGLREFGNTVLVRHEDGLVTVYGHASQLKVSRGDTVRRGQEIALSGTSGSADSPRLHFEVRKDSRPVDPLTFLE